MLAMLACGASLATGSPVVGKEKGSTKTKAIPVRLVGQHAVKTASDREELTIEMRAPRQIQVTKYYIATPHGRFRLAVRNDKLQSRAKELDGKAVVVEVHLIGQRLLNMGRALLGEEQFFIETLAIVPKKTKR